MDKKTLEMLERLREILLNIDIYGYQGHRTSLSYEKNKCLRKMLGNLAQTLSEECIIRYKTRKRIARKIRKLIKESD